MATLPQQPQPVTPVAVPGPAAHPSARRVVEFLAHTGYVDVRCGNCKRLLCRANPLAVVEIKCPGCKLVNNVSVLGTL